MIAALLFVLSLLDSPPSREVSANAARQAGIPWAAEELHRVALAESKNTRQGRHEGPNRRGRDFFDRAVAVGWLEICQQHDPDAWGVRGTYGLVAAYHVRHLGPCAEARAVDVPIVGAYLAALHWRYLARRGFCDYKARRAAYKGGARSPEALAELERCRNLNP